MKSTAGKQHRMSTSLKLVHAAENLRVKPSCVFTLRCVLKGLSNVGDSDSVAKQYAALGILDVLPTVLRQRSKKVVTLGLEILGALSLSSQTMNHLVLSKREIICALVENFTSSDVELLSGAFNTLEDVLITAEGLEIFKKSFLVENLIRVLCVLADLSRKAESGPEAEGENFDKSVAATAQVPKLLKNLDVHQGKRCSQGVFSSELETLVGTCVRTIATMLPGQGLKTVPTVLYVKSLSILQQHWSFLLEEEQLLYDGVDPSTWNWYRKSESRHEVAKCLLLLGMEYDYCSGMPGLDEEKSSGIAVLSTLKFRDKVWERFPLLVTKAMPSCLVTFAKRFSTEEKLLKDLLSKFTTCPSASADEVDSFMYFREVESTLGDPLKYGRDIRILKTPKDLDVLNLDESEVHFFPTEPESSGDKHVHPQAMLKAVRMGFSLAIKGLELRCPDIASLSVALARQFGQPSVGVNLYVTPPNAQGLAVHFDDHCVLVCQLLGNKSWKIFPPVDILPRLYGSRFLDEEALDNASVEEVTLEEGNVLYIPRGYPHKAFCDAKSEEKPQEVNVFEETTGLSLGSSETSESDLTSICNSAYPVFGRNRKKQKITFRCSDFTEGETEAPRDAVDNSISVHLTFGIEVEPPFEWEGLVHIALRLWVHQRWRSGHEADSEIHHNEEDLCEALFHVAIRNLGDNDIRFRKACMIAAETPSQSCLEKPVGSTPTEMAYGKNGVSRCGAPDPLGCDLCSESSLIYFQDLIAIVHERVSFSEALRVARSYLKSTKDEIDVVGMEWLRHIPNTSERFEDTRYLDPIFLLQQSKLEKFACVRRTFTNMKVGFEQAYMFHDSSQVFRTILSQYTTIRKRHRNGMLALHGGIQF